MRILVFSDIHGNLPAFEKMLSIEKGIDLYVSLGDVVNYGPWSNECVDLLESIHAVRLMGNHEKYFLERNYPGKHHLVKKFFNECLAGFDRWVEISKYVDSFEYGAFKFQHTIREAYVFPDSEISVVGNFFIGHSHHQFDRSGDSYRVVNVGSVGQNRSEINVINYAIYEPECDRVLLKGITYEIQPLIKRMRALRYPEDCVDYYLKKTHRSVDH